MDQTYPRYLHELFCFDIRLVNKFDHTNLRLLFGDIGRQIKHADGIPKFVVIPDQHLD